jgi:hypothetical protein
MEMICFQGRRGTRNTTCYLANQPPCDSFATPAGEGAAGVPFRRHAVGGVRVHGAAAAAQVQIRGRPAPLRQRPTRDQRRGAALLARPQGKRPALQRCNSCESQRWGFGWDIAHEAVRDAR